MTERLTMVGLSGSGKTTYVIALACALDEAGESGRRLAASQLSPSGTYINRQIGHYGQCNPVTKTRFGDEQDVRFFVRDRQTGLEFELVCPDLSGETYDDCWERRQWSQERDREVAESSGLLIFLRRDRNHAASMLDEEHRLAGDEQDGAIEPNKAETWSADTASNQVKLVEALQFVRARLSRRVRIAVVVSAWDRETVNADDPETWLKVAAPLLWQVLRAHADSMPYRVFGVSAQGGHYPQEAEKLRRIDPSNRPTVSGGGVDPHQQKDISLPVSWVLFGDA